MADGNEMALHVEELEQVVDSVFITMMGLEVQARAAAAEWPARPCIMTASIHLHGAFEGTILMHYLPAQACEFAGSFLGMPPPVAVDDDVRDVLGELANMIAGNLKCTLGPG